MYAVYRGKMREDAFREVKVSILNYQSLHGGLNMANGKPCLTCTRVADPEKCENINCKAWREWFLKKWGELRGGK
jgi:hypothetical protein